MRRTVDRARRTRPDQNETTAASRRGFLGLAAALGGVALAGCSGSPGGGGAATEAETPTDSPTPTEAMTDSPTPTGEPTTDVPTEEPMEASPDVAVLNYALTLEHLENAFYREGLSEFGDDELMEADALDAFGEEVRMQVPEYLAQVGDHEAAHVKAISKTVEKLGGDPVGEAEYDFGYSTPTEFLAVAKALENTGVAAYAGAAPSIRSNAVLSAAAGIHSVEARHAGFLNLVNSTSPFPKAVDGAKSMEEVLEIAGQFIVEG